jgi:hypothetical protein
MSVGFVQNLDPPAEDVAPVETDVVTFFSLAVFSKTS